LTYVATFDLIVTMFLHFVAYLRYNSMKWIVTSVLLSPGGKSCQINSNNF